jgi:glycosyltransferase involved in cell wall biosynthesis
VSSPRTILFLHPSAELYGADRTLLQLVQGLDGERWRAVVLLPRRGQLARELEAAGALVEIGELGIGARASLSPRGLLQLAWRVPLGALQVLRTVRRHRPSLIHTNTMVVLGGALGARLSGVPHLWHVHEILAGSPRLARVYARLLSLLAQRVISNSQATRRSFDRWYAPLAPKHEVILNGVEETPRAPGHAREELRSALGMAPDQPLVSLVGRVNSWKGQQVLVRAAGRLRARFPEARYVLAGGAPQGQPHYERELDALISRLELSEVVLRLPFQADVASLYAASDVCCVPSTRPEPFGLVAAEAMSAARPVVASDQGGLSEIVVSGVTGILVRPGDAPSLAEALEQLFLDPERARAMGRAGRRRQRRCFSVERYCREFAGHYDSLARDRRHAPLPYDTRIVHLVLGKANPERLNGVSRAVHYLAAAQAAAGRALEVWGLTPTPEAAAGERPYPLRLFRRGRLRGLLPRELRRAIAQLRGPTVVHLHGGLLPEMASAARRLTRLGVPLVFTPHGAYNPRALAKRPLLKRLCMALVDRAVLRRARCVQAFTAAEARASARWLPFERIAVVPNGQALPPLPEGGRRPGEALRLGFCGRLDAHTKGLDLLLEGFALFLARGARAQLVLIGDGPDRAALERRAACPDLRDRVEFSGALFDQDKTRRLLQLDAFVHPSRHEGMPMAVLEAASLGRPLLVSEGTHLAADVLEFDAGPALADSGAEGLAQALGRLASADPEQLEDWGRNARRMVAERFAWEHVEPLAARRLYGIAAHPTEGDERSSGRRLRRHGDSRRAAAASSGPTSSRISCW